jgi:UbiD family decarboxylase
MENLFVDQRSALEFCEQKGEVLCLSKEVDPLYEMAAITKSFDGGPALIFDRIKGYPGWKAVTNLMSRRERIAGFLRATKQELPQRIIEAVFHPAPPRVIDHAPCQEVVIDRGIDILAYLPVIKQTTLDIGPVISGGVVMIQIPKELAKESSSFNLSFHRLNPGLSKDWLSLATLYNRHFLEVLYFHKERKEEYPITINLGLSPALNIVASGGAFPQIRPMGSDDLGVAGNLQGVPVEICRAKTVDAYALANAEVVIEGKVLYDDKITEIPMQEAPPKAKGPGKPPYFFPEFLGYEGMADRAFKVQVTAITHRKDPFYYTPLADSFESSQLGALISEASIYHACKNTAPSIFVNCHILDGMRGILGAVVQCRITHEMQQGISQNLISAAFGAMKDLKWVIAVDEDVDIYDPSDVLWAVTVRCRADEDVNILKGAGIGNLFATKWSVDTTVPVADKWRARRPKYEPIDLKRWLTEGEIAKGLSLMGEGARSIAKRRV